MRRGFVLGIFLAVGLLLGACGNFSFRHPMGIPTITYPDIGDFAMSSEAGTYTISFTLNTYTLPGSPGGTISFRLQSGDLLPGSAMRVNACPGTADENCGPFSNRYGVNFDAPPSEGDLVIVSYQAVGDNGNMLEVRLPTPLRIY